MSEPGAGHPTRHRASGIRPPATRPGSPESADFPLPTPPAAGRQLPGSGLPAATRRSGGEGLALSRAGFSPPSPRTLTGAGIEREATAPRQSGALGGTWFPPDQLLPLFHRHGRGGWGVRAAQPTRPRGARAASERTPPLVSPHTGRGGWGVRAVPHPHAREVRLPRPNGRHPGSGRRGRRADGPMVWRSHRTGHRHRETGPCLPPPAISHQPPAASRQTTVTAPSPPPPRPPRSSPSPRGRASGRPRPWPPRSRA